MLIPSGAYYNEHDSRKAKYLRNLIKAGAIAPGEVDERSIEDVTPDELMGFSQCHFFAGIGVWSYALRQAGWEDRHHVWTASCPCQPFSTAGKGAGFDDERHLWPALYWLICQSRPRVVFGEQVADGGGRTWLDLVQTDMENADFAFAPVGLCAAGFGAPHQRHRFFFVADAQNQRWGEELSNDGWGGQRNSTKGYGTGCDAGGATGIVADMHGERCERERLRFLPRGPRQAGAETAGSGATGELEHTEHHKWHGSGNARQAGRDELADRGSLGGMADPPDRQFQEQGWREEGRDGDGPDSQDDTRCSRGPGPTNGFWRDADWLRCRDELWRPVEARTFPLAPRSPERVGRLAAYGDCIVAPVAIEFIKAYMEIATC